MTNPDKIPNKSERRNGRREYQNNQKNKRPKRSQSKRRQHSTLDQGNGRKDGGNTSNPLEFNSKWASAMPPKKSNYQLASDPPQTKTTASYHIQNPSTTTVSIIENGCRKNPSLPVLHWYSPNAYVPLAKEKELLDVLLLFKKRERGMLSRQPNARLRQIREKCSSVGVSMIQACSLRRHHLKLLNPFENGYQLGLGTENNVRESAAEFEKAVASFLTKSKVQYKSEEEQRKKFKGTPSGPTPDFVLEGPVSIICTSEIQRNGIAPKHFSNIPAIKWIEAKMFYGASTIPHDNKSAVGRILLTARKYVKHFGNGVMVFAYGCGDSLARELAEIGVLALDAHPIDLRSVEESQRKWCAGESGEILP